MSHLNPGGEIVFSTPWFHVLARRPPGIDQPYYAIQSSDVAVVVAVNSREELLLVRQFRPAVEMITLELPAGHIEASESAEEAARKELWEETGHEAGTMELLTKLSPSTARFTNRLWCFFASNVKPSQRAQPREPGVEFLYYERGVQSLLDEKEFLSAASCAALFAAAARGRLQI